MKRRILMLAAVAAAFASAKPVTGTFVQKKFLRDVDVTLTSTGTFAFDRGRSFTWHTLKPVENVFCATPTNYAVTAGGRTSVRALETDVTSIEQVFTIREVKELVAKIDVKRAAGAGADDLPEGVEVSFRNGDRLSIALTPHAPR